MNNEIKYKTKKAEKPLGTGRRIGRIILLSVALLLIIAIGVAVAIPSVNNRIADRVMKKLAKTSLPEGTTIVEKRSFAGNLAGNGNKMQYLGALLVKSDMNGDELESLFELSTGLDCTVTKQIDGNIMAVTNADASFNAAIAGDNYYSVIAWGNTSVFFLDLDIRAY